MKKRVMRQFRRANRNLLRDRQIVEDILDEMATKWAVRAEKMQRQAFGKMHSKINTK